MRNTLTFLSNSHIKRTWNIIILLDKTKKGEYSCLTIRKVILLKKTRKVRQCLHHA